jgi:hypothetical protein
MVAVDVMTSVVPFPRFFGLLLPQNTGTSLKKIKSKGNLGEDSQSICLLTLDCSKIDPTRPGLSDAMLCDAP